MSDGLSVDEREKGAQFPVPACFIDESKHVRLGVRQELVCRRAVAFPNCEVVPDEEVVANRSPLHYFDHGLTAPYLVSFWT